MELVALGFGGEQVSRKGGSVHTTAMKGFADLGAQLGHLEGDMMHGLTWFKDRSCLSKGSFAVVINCR